MLQNGGAAVERSRIDNNYDPKVFSDAADDSSKSYSPDNTNNKTMDDCDQKIESASTTNLDKDLNADVQVSNTDVINSVEESGNPMISKTIQSEQKQYSEEEINTETHKEIETCQQQSKTSEKTNKGNNTLANVDIHSEDAQGNYKECEGPTEFNAANSCLPSIKDEVQIESTASFELMQLATKLGLEMFYPNKIKQMDIIRIKPTTLCSGIKDIPWVVLQNLMMINSTCRDTMVSECLELLSLEDSQLDESRGAIETDDIFSNLGLDENHENETFNPLDIMLLLFKCSSLVLQMVLAAKLFTCKLAIPLIFPSESKEPVINSSFLHDVIIDEIVDGKGMRQISAIDVSCKTACFLRMGRPSFSKSNMINAILSDSGYGTFFNVNCPLGKTKRIISEGLVEAAWFIPSTTNKTFENVMMILNLRGDCLTNKIRDQFEIVSALSDVMIIFTKLDDLQDLHVIDTLKDILQTIKGGIILAIDASRVENMKTKTVLMKFISQIDNNKQKMKLCLVANGSEVESVSVVKKEICKRLSTLLCTVDVKPFSDKLHDTFCQRAKSDEETTEHRNVKHTIINIMKCIPENLQNMQAVLTPLQGTNWHIWSNNLKTINNTSKFKSIEKRSKLVEEMEFHRLEQLRLWREEMHPFIIKCLVSLECVSDNDSDLGLFTAWMKVILDRRARCLDILNKTDAVQQNSMNSDEHDSSRQTESTPIPFRFEHICREMGQIYEALYYCQTSLQDEEVRFLDSLPNIGAKLLLNGQPMEIMDGDVANVPLEWVQAILFKLKDIVGNKKILTLSVVGVQSSGKSTLLNTMFGLQFQVSASRSTKGAYMQLITVDEESFDFDYILVFDSEGLRSSNQTGNNPYHHDNKLATFVVGLGDITIVNVKGSNTSDVKDVLQTVVHAFLRLKNVNKSLNYKQSCIFAHQNVSASDASEQMQDERHALVQLLNEMTLSAAEQENIADIMFFNQVIDFDSDKDVKYFSDLWYGDPPMAPANPGYSRRAAEVKHSMIRKSSKERKAFFQLTDTVTRIRDLWNGILRDDFVHSFRNTLELKAYNAIERKYHEITWKMEKAAREFRTTKAKIILLEYEHYDIEQAVTSITSSFTQENDQLLNVLGHELRSFIECNPLKEIMSQWEETKVNKLKVLSDDLIFKTRTEVNNIKEEIRIEKLSLAERTKHEAAINDQARKLAYKMKGKIPDDDVMNETFENMWISWLNSFDPKHTDDIKPVKDQLEDLLCERFTSDMAYMKREDYNDPQYKAMVKLEDSFHICDIADDDISVRNVLNARGTEQEIKERILKYKQQTVSAINKMFRKIDIFLKEKEQQDIRFDTADACEALLIVEKEIENHNDGDFRRCPFYLLTKFRAKILNHVVCYITIVFTRINDKYNKKHSPRRQIEQYKATACKLFKNLVESKTEDMISINFFRDAVIVEVTKQVSKQIHLDVENEIFDEFKHEKYQLMKAVMIDLALKENFDDYQVFIKNPAKYTKDWLTLYSHKLVFEQSVGDSNRYQLYAKRRIDKIYLEIMDTISKELVSSTTNVVHSLSIWVDEFIKSIMQRGVLPLTKDAFSHVYKRTTSDISNFQQILKEDLEDIKIETYDNFRKKDENYAGWMLNSINTLMKRLWGCTEICMFCKEPCMLIEKEHVEDGQSHHCIQHRPEGIGGFSYYHDNTLSVEFCNMSIQNEKMMFRKDIPEWRFYKDYKIHFPDWEIQPTYDTSKYWMWVLCKYKHELIDLYDAELPNIPSSWLNITKEKAIRSLTFTE